MQEAAKAYSEYEKKTQKLRTEEWNKFLGGLRNSDI
jgi:hypothetical protein